MSFVVMAGCYSPNVLDGAFKCSADQDFVCPEGLSCDMPSGLCVHGSVPDMAIYDSSVTFDLTLTPIARDCDQRVRDGAFSNLTNLGAAVNSAGDESGLSLSLDDKQIYFLDGAGALQSATLSADGHSAGAPTAVTLTGAPTTLSGAGSCGTDGSYWFAGANGNASGVYQATKVSITSFNVGTAHLPMATATCLIADVALTDGDSKGDMYVSWPLAGCATGTMVAQGNVDKQLGAFVGVLPVMGYHAPSVVKGGHTMLVSSTGGAGRLSYAQRPSPDVTWTGPTVLPLGGLGDPSGRDVQAIVNQSCTHLYLVASRAGGHGGLDLWAADIAPQ